MAMNIQTCCLSIRVYKASYIDPESRTYNSTHLYSMLSRKNLIQFSHDDINAIPCQWYLDLYAKILVYA
jgi:hypothetical protein